MSEWWTYGLSDFLLFSPRTYYRLLDLYNAEYWPMQLAALLVGAALAAAAIQGKTRIALAMLSACWLWVAWAFLFRYYATIHWAAPWFALAFAAEGALLLLASAFGDTTDIRANRTRAVRLGLGLLLFALLVQPWLGLLPGRMWKQAEVFGMAPDPTALGTLGVLLAFAPRAPWKWLLWPIPALWCAIGAATAWTIRANG